MTLRRPLVLAAGVRGELPNGDQLPIDALQLPQGYIDGLQMQWVSGTALTVTSGAAYIEGSSKVLRSTSAIAKAGLSLSASTWYHVYLYDNSGIADVEIVTTAPASPYNGTARSKTGDNSRRYVGSIKTDGSGSIINFKHYLDVVRYLYASFVVLSSGLATSATTVSCSSFVPVTGVSFYFRAIADSSANLLLLNVDAPGVTLLQVSANSNAYVELPLDGSQKVQYYNQSAPSSGATIAGFSYRYQR